MPLAPLVIDADWAAAIEQARRAGDLYRQCDDARAAARAQAIAGQALRGWLRFGEAREQLTAALAVLQEDPDTATVQALGELAALEVYAGSPAADPLSAEALALGQALAVDDATLAGLFTTRGMCQNYTYRRPQAVASFREAARLAEQAGDTARLASALFALPTRSPAPTPPPARIRPAPPPPTRAGPAPATDSCHRGHSIWSRRC